MRIGPIPISPARASFEIDPIPSPRIDNFGAQLIHNGNFDTASSLSNLLCKQFEAGASQEEIVNLVLRQHSSVIDWIANQSHSALYDAIASFSNMKPLSQALNTTLNCIHLAALAQVGKFIPFAVFYLFDRALQSNPQIEDRAIVEELFKQYPKLPISLRSQSLPDFRKKIEKFCQRITNREERAEHIDVLLETAYFTALENSPLFALASRFENETKRQIEESLARATPHYWLQFCSTAFTDGLHQKEFEPEQIWKYLFQELRKAAYFKTLSQESMKTLILDLNLLSNDISYFDKNQPEGQQLSILIREAKKADGKRLLFPRCNEHLKELQKKLEICRNHFQPETIVKVFNTQTKNFHEILQAHKYFSSSFDAESFFNIFATPIYQASVIYFFHVLISSDMRFWPSRLCEAWKQSLTIHQIDQSLIISLDFKDYERMIYDVWDLFSAEYPKCTLIDISDLLKRKIKSLDSDSLCQLYEAMNKEPQETRYNILLSFFSDNGNPRDLNWLLEDLLS